MWHSGLSALWMALAVKGIKSDFGCAGHHLGEVRRFLQQARVSVCAGEAPWMSFSAPTGPRG
jgi:hypothetical protein